MSHLFQIIESIGSGQFSLVFLAKRKRKTSQEPVAIKVEKEDNPITMIQYESKIMHYLNEQQCYHIPAVYWYGMFEGRPSLAMTYYSFSLETYICKDEFPREPKEPEKILCEIVKIMKSVHEAKVIHCDIKPANFMMKNDQIYLVDFGLSKIYVDENGENFADSYDQQQFLGTPKYISVYIHQGHSPSLRDDIISCLYVYLFSKTKHLYWDKLPEKPLQNDDLPENHIHEFRNQERYKKKVELYKKIQDTHLGKALSLMENTLFGGIPDYTKLLNLFVNLI